MDLDALDNNPKWINFRYYGSMIYFPVALILYIFYPQLASLFMAGAIVSVFFIVSRRLKASTFIDNILNQEIGYSKERLFYFETFPDYQFIDIYNFLINYLKQNNNFTKKPISNNESLNDIINHRFHSELNRNPHESENIPWKIDVDEEVYRHIDNLWILKANYKDKENINHFTKVIRLRYDKYNDSTYLEVCTMDPDFFDNFIKELKIAIIKNSIYKGKVISITSNVVEGIDYGEKNTKVGIQFQKINKIDEENIVLSDKIKKILEFNIFEYFEHRELLTERLSTMNRGLLFYGPPGTGKSFTCQYLFGRLNQITIIVASGQSLSQINTICSIGRTLQPSIVLLEDVDLVFSSREINPYSSSLGDLMNQLDGYTKKEHMLFILTTNHISRVEKAIKDRPGRISQCVFFDLPNLELREKYLKNEIKNNAIPDLNITEVAKKIDGASQAFISELVKLAMQFNLQSLSYESNSKIFLNEQDFDAALELMLRDNNEYSKSILGINQSIL
ncbi:MAG: ATP-binding protein [Leptospiraceae bacterium]|nr:ATP-binding protein [Leptospiraceae bacterium]